MCPKLWQVARAMVSDMGASLSSSDKAKTSLNMVVSYELHDFISSEMAKFVSALSSAEDQSTAISTQGLSRSRISLNIKPVTDTTIKTVSLRSTWEWAPMRLMSIPHNRLHDGTTRCQRNAR
ncbi:hypothetical protein V6N11_078271 [Hibiscus sabdariffa]|uniref:Uncharacterized protein n=1 Tax=Hibiscus sabdariffa TaxID=183260 RepID=A0ABR2TGJ2_9ROSI